jgi:hypothetical protein
MKQGLGNIRSVFFYGPQQRPQKENKRPVCRLLDTEKKISFLFMN